MATQEELTKAGIQFYQVGDKYYISDPGRDMKGGSRASSTSRLSGALPSGYTAKLLTPGTKEYEGFSSQRFGSAKGLDYIDKLYGTIQSDAQAIASQQKAALGETPEKQAQFIADQNVPQISPEQATANRNDLLPNGITPGQASPEATTKYGQGAESATTMSPQDVEAKRNEYLSKYGFAPPDTELASGSLSPASQAELKNRGYVEGGTTGQAGQTAPVADVGVNQREKIISTFNSSLGRTPSESEISWWMGQSTPIDVGVKQSLEYQSKSKSNSIKSWYETNLGRTPSNEEIDYWANSPVPVEVGGKDSEEYKNHQADLLNKDSNIITDVINTGKDSADKTLKTITDANSYAENFAKEKTALELYNEQFKTPEMKTASDDVIALKDKLQAFDDQIEELKNDIRKEVEGEAPDSYITALATIRGEDILKQKRLVQREYDTALAKYTSMKEDAQAVTSMTLQDQNTRYDRLFQALQLQIQQEGTNFNQGVALANIAMAIPEGRSITLPSGVTVKGMKETDNLNVVNFTDANRNNYVIAIDKNTGQEIYRTFIGQSAASGGGGSGVSTLVKQVQEKEAGMQLDFMKKVEQGAYAIATDDEGSFYYDVQAYDAALLESTGGSSSPKGWLYSMFSSAPDKRDYWVADA